MLHDDTCVIVSRRAKVMQRLVRKYDHAEVIGVNLGLVLFRRQLLSAQSTANYTLKFRIVIVIRYWSELEMSVQCVCVIVYYKLFVSITLFCSGE